jgi:hypothetical protein
MGQAYTQLCILPGVCFYSNLDYGDAFFFVTCLVLVINYQPREVPSDPCRIIRRE